MLEPHSELVHNVAGYEKLGLLTLRAVFPTEIMIMDKVLRAPVWIRIAPIAASAALILEIEARFTVELAVDLATIHELLAVFLPVVADV
jgi:hypothetical protein